MRLGAQFNSRIDRMVQGNQAAIQVDYCPLSGRMEASER